MFAFIVLAHPSPGSLNHAFADAAQTVLQARGFEVALHDLYAERFDPVQPVGESGNTASIDPLVELHCEQIARANVIVVIHPNWWGQPPAVLKGWVDRVLRLDTAYGYPAGVGFEGVPVGLLKAHAALVFNTSNTPHQRELALFGDPLETLWKNCIFGLCGVTNMHRRMFAPVAGSSDAQRAAWVEEVKNLTNSAIAPVFVQ